MIYHILNGDCLKEQFPESISGESIVTRECLVDGDVQGESLQELFDTRAKFINTLDGDYSVESYFVKVVSEFDKIGNIPDNSEVNLWFEDDLFCQVNLWFVLHLLNESNSKNIILHIVRPTTHIQFGFGRMSSSELSTAFHQKRQIDEPTLGILRKLWRLYQNKQYLEMLKLVEVLEKEYDFVKTAILAEMERHPDEGSIGGPKQTLLNIMNELQTDDFGIIFREFQKKEAAYGFGDLQVKRLLDEIENSKE